MATSQTVPILGSDGSAWDVPLEHANDAIQQGGKLGINIVGKDGSRWTIPTSNLGEALKTGARIESPDAPVNNALVSGVLQRDPRVPTQFEKDRSGGKGTLASLISDIRGGLIPTAQNPYPGMGLEQKQQAAQQSVAEDQSRKDAGYGPAYRAIAPVAESFGANVPGMEQAAAKGDIGGVAGHAVAPIATYAVVRGAGSAVSAIKDFLPNSERAGANFQVAMNAAGDKPIDLSAPGDSALRIQELANRGGQMPKVVRNFISRATDPTQGPLTYAEARDFYSNASRLSSAEFQKLTPVMQRAVGQFTADLGQSIGATAESAGVGPEYRSAMSEYRNVKRMQSARQALVEYVAKPVAKGLPYGAGVGAGVGAGYAIYKASQ